MSREDYERALAEVVDAARVFHGGVTDPVTTGDGGTVWSPIYRELMGELEARLHIAGHRYERAADALGIPVADRFDWRSHLSAD